MNASHQVGILDSVDSIISNYADCHLMVKLDEISEHMFGSEIFSRISSGDIEYVKQYIATNPNNVNIKNGCGLSLVQHSCMYSQYDIADFLLNNGANPNLPNVGGLTCMHWVVSNNDERFIPLLLKWKCDPKAKNLAGKTPLEHSILWKKYDVYSKYVELC